MQTRARGMGMSFVTRFKILAESEKISEDLQRTGETQQNAAKNGSPGNPVRSCSAPLGGRGSR